MLVFFSLHFVTFIGSYSWLRFEMLARNAWTPPDPFVMVGLFSAATLFNFSALMLSSSSRTPVDAVWWEWRPLRWPPFWRSRPQCGQPDVAKLLDFGLVQDLSAEADDRLTGTGTVLGTPAYMSLEQAVGDVYALGAVAFFALAGLPPFERRTVGRLLATHRSEPPPTLTDLRPDVPADLAAIVARCLAKDPADRYPSAADLDRALGLCSCGLEWEADLRRHVLA